MSKRRIPNLKNMGAEEKWLAATSAFLEEKERIGVSKTTIRNYSRRLNMFYEFWAESLPDPSSHRKQEDPSYVDFLEWRNYLQETGLKNTSIRQYLRELKGFYDWASDPFWGEDRFYEMNPISKRLFPTCRNEDTRPYDTILTNNEIISLYKNEIPEDKTCWFDLWPRNYAIVVFLMETEVRNAELLDLRLCDIDFEDEVVHVEHGKGNKYRCVDLSPLAQSAVKLYLASGLRPDGVSDDDYLFGNCGMLKYRKGTKLQWKRGTYAWLSDLVTRHVKNVTGVDGVGTHDLRHVGAKVDLNLGMRLEELQSKLGHSSMDTTLLYSGRLLGRKQRLDTQRIPAERELWTQRNEQKLAQIQAQK